MSFWMTRYRKPSGRKLSRGTRIRFMRWVLVCRICLRNEPGDITNNQAGSKVQPVHRAGARDRAAISANCCWRKHREWKTRKGPWVFGECVSRRDASVPGRQPHGRPRSIAWFCRRADRAPRKSPRRGRPSYFRGLTSSGAATAGEIAARLDVRFVLRGAMQFSKRV
jgi:hypothetical protein